jgi:hypothetical protein
LNDDELKSWNSKKRAMQRGGELYALYEKIAGARGEK